MCGSAAAARRVGERDESDSDRSAVSSGVGSMRGDDGSQSVSAAGSLRCGAKCGSLAEWRGGDGSGKKSKAGSTAFRSGANSCQTLEPSCDCEPRSDEWFRGTRAVDSAALGDAR